MTVSRALAITLAVALVAAVASLGYIVYWTTHFACTQYKPF